MIRPPLDLRLAPTFKGKLKPVNGGYAWFGKCPDCGWALKHCVQDPDELPRHRISHCQCHDAHGYFISA